VTQMVESPLVEEVKNLTKDLATREKWAQYCAIFGQGVKDPSKHPEKFLAGFIAGFEATAADECQIFVGGLAPDCTDELIMEYFSKWGEITKLELKIPKGFGFITFSSADPVEAIMANHASHQINGKFVDCKRAENRRGQIPMAAQKGIAKGLGKGVKGFVPQVAAVPQIPVQTRFTGIRPVAFQVQQPSVFPLQRTKFVPQFQPAQPTFQFAANPVKGLGKGRAVVAAQPTPTGPADEAQIFVGGVPLDCPDETVAEYFSKWGEVARIEMKTGKGFGFVTFTTADPIEAILANHDSHTINGKFVDCKRAENRRKTAADFIAQGAAGVPGVVGFAPVRQTQFGVMRAAPFI